MAQIDVVLPCLDEAEGLAWVLDRMPPGCRPVVVDNGSTDRTAEVARAAGAVVVTAARRGYGAACAAGLAAATADVVAMMDADGTLDPRAVPAPWPNRCGTGGPIWSWPGAARSAGPRGHGGSGWRTGCSPGGWRDVAGVRLLTSVRCGSLGASSLVGLGVTDRRSGYPVETVLRAAERGWRIRAMDVAYLPRLGRSKVTGTARGTLQAVTDVRAVLRS